MALRFSWSPPAPPPFPNWVILERAAQLPPDAEDPAAPSLLLRLREPPRVSNVFVPLILHPKRFSDGPDSAPYIIAANDAGLLLHVSYWPFRGFDLTPMRYLTGVLEVATDFVEAAGNGRATGAAERVPLPPNGISSIRNVGMASIPGTRRREYVIAELRIPVPRYGANADADGPRLYTFRSGANAWVRTHVSCNGWDWSERVSDWDVLVHDVIAHGGNLWWVDLKDGLIGGDPLAVDDHGDTVLRYVSLPPELDLNGDDIAPLPENIEHARMVSVSNRKVRCVGMRRLRDQPPELIEVYVWTLVQRPALSWKPRSMTSLGAIWAHESYIDKAELTEEVPVLALLHPTDPDVVYFFLAGYLFGVDVLSSEVVDFLPLQHGLRQVVAPLSWRHVVPWLLPNSLEHVLDYEYYPADTDEEMDD